MATIMRRMNIISRAEGIYRTDRLQEEELAACHHSYILVLGRRPGISQEELAREICVNKSNVTRNLAYLESKGYVERRPSTQDRRVMLVYPTEKMQAVLPKVRQIVLDWNDYLSAGFSGEELAVFASVLDRMVERARAYRERGEETP